jgi:protein-disulfide isomerase
VLEKYPGKVRLVVKDFPLRNHRFSRPAAQAALAAGLQNRFWEYHDSLLKNMRNLSEELFISTAKDLGLDLAKFEKDRKSPYAARMINRDLAEGGRIGVRGTPSVFVNGKKVKQRSLEAISSLIEGELAAGPHP